ncbi:hypothetical protein [Pseudophaeobacter arcticus]|uniref:hypothetical protein n=1 Tax=Pseudophaeobacter arcticus TaxID=385492 RepID=UPI001378BBA8|nr:hypothetical protein [Pseudophaeobacter arcticus]
MTADVVACPGWQRAQRRAANFAAALGTRKNDSVIGLKKTDHSVVSFAGRKAALF